MHHALLKLLLTDYFSWPWSTWSTCHLGTFCCHQIRPDHQTVCVLCNTMEQYNITHLSAAARSVDIRRHPIKLYSTDAIVLHCIVSWNMTNSVCCVDNNSVNCTWYQEANWIPATSFEVNLLTLKVSLHVANHVVYLSLIHIWRCRRSYACRSRWSPYH